MQTLTDFTASAYPIAGVSGLLELTGLAIWGVSLLWLMCSRPAIQTLTTTASIAGPITGESVVAEVLEQYPWLLEAFVAAGFGLLRNRVLRSTLARWTTINQACQRMGVDRAGLLESLNVERHQPPVTQTIYASIPTTLNA
jgi:hypothetical protein